MRLDRVRSPRTCFRVSINFRHAMQIRHGPEFFGSGSDMQICQTRPWSQQFFWSQGSVTTPNFCHVVQACKLQQYIARGLFLAHLPAALSPSEASTFSPTTMARPWYHQPIFLRSTKNAYSDHDALTPGSLRYSPIRPDEKRRHHLLAWT